MIKNIQKQIDETENKLKDLKKQKLEEDRKDIWVEIPEKGIAITNKLQYLGKTYPEILKEVDESQIADYPLLQELRNEGFKSNWKKYGFLKDAWAFVPNPDEVSKSEDRVARFNVSSGDAGLYCWVDSGDSYSTLGVFLVKKINKNENKKNK